MSKRVTATEAWTSWRRNMGSSKDDHKGFRIPDDWVTEDKMNEGFAWKNEDGEECKDRLEVFEAKLRHANEQSDKASDRVIYLAQIVQEAKINPAFRALLEVGL